MTRIQFLTLVVPAAALALTACGERAPEAEALSVVYEASEDGLEAVETEIGRQTYAVHLFLRFHDQANRLVMMADGEMTETEAAGRLAALARDAIETGVDEARIREARAAHRAAFERFSASLDDSLSEAALARLPDLADRYDRLVYNHQDPLPLLVRLNHVWAVETGRPWPESDMFYGYRERIDAALGDPALSELVALGLEWRDEVTRGSARPQVRFEAGSVAPTETWN